MAAKKHLPWNTLSNMVFTPKPASPVNFKDSCLPGIAKEDAYPYVGIRESCKYNKTDVFAKLESYIQIEAGDEETLLRVVGFLGPTSVALDATGLVFYSKG